MFWSNTESANSRVAKILSVLAAALFVLIAYANLNDIFCMHFFDSENPVWTSDACGWKRTSKTKYTIICAAHAVFYIFAAIAPLFIKNKRAVNLIRLFAALYIFANILYSSI